MTSMEDTQQRPQNVPNSTPEKFDTWRRPAEISKVEAEAGRLRRPDDIPNLWNLHGQYYDFSDYQRSHPGGATLLMLGRGRDSTELWESVHQFAQNPTVFKHLFDKYRVEVRDNNSKEVRPEDGVFDWTPEGGKFFYELQRRAREYFAKTGDTIKADVTFAVFFSIYSTIMISGILYFLTHRSFLVTTITAFMISFEGFAIMHTASHFGLSTRPLINWFAFASYCNLFGWFHHLWLQHHVWGHHSYTGILHKDPDITNIPKRLVRKHADIEWMPHHEKNLKQELFLLWIFPNQFVGQAAQYVCTLWRGSVFGMDVVQVLTPVDVVMTVAQSCMCLFLFIALPVMSTGPAHLFYVAWCYFIMGIMYFSCVVPNHEVLDVELSNAKPTQDWSIEQITHSANFKVPYFLSYLMGGMNYQIEHHLFPSVHPRHYPALSKIVREMCAEQDIPYICHSSWLNAIKDHFNFMKYFAQPQSSNHKTN